MTPVIGEVRKRVEEVDDGFEDFYRRELLSAVRLATLVTSVADGEDVAHDAFLAVRRRWPTLDEPAAYLRRTVVNQARQLHRARGRRAAREALCAQPEAVDAEHLEVLDVLAALPHDQRVTLVLRLWAAWPDAEIAAALGCRPSTVRSHAKRGLATLRRRLA